MEKRYQIFISSTFVDLEEERKAVMEAIITLDCFPAGMEMFPADNREQFEYIKTIIDDSDYYILIISGRYGSLAEDGKSYTEKEFDYAIEKGIPVLVFVKNDIGSIPICKTDNDPVKHEKLEKFRERAMKSRMAKYWDDYKDLRYEVNSSLNRAFKTNPRTGWIKGDIAATTTTLLELEKLRKEKDKLEKCVEELTVKVNEKKEKQLLSHGDDLFQIECICTRYEDSEWDNECVDISWNEIFITLAEIIRDGYIIEKDAKKLFESSLCLYVNKNYHILEISDRTFNIIKFQLEAIELLEISTSNGCEVYSLTEKGKKSFRDLLIIKR